MKQKITIKTNRIMLQLSLIGTLGHDATEKTINGKNYLAYSVAVTENKNTTWVDVMTRNENGNLKAYLKKGAKVFIQGNISVSTYTNKAGAPMASISLWSREMEIVKFVDTSSGDAAPSPAPADAPVEPSSGAPKDDEDDLPF